MGWPKCGDFERAYFLDAPTTSNFIMQVIVLSPLPFYFTTLAVLPKDLSLLPRFAADDKSEVHAKLHRYNNDKPLSFKSQVAKKSNLIYEIST